MVNNRKKPEVLAPASSLEVLKTAVYYGADAVYIGGEMYGLRAKAKNFSKEDMAEGVRFAHEHGKKVYVTANITAHDRDLEGVQKYFEELKEIGPDALIISDPGVFQIATEICPEIDIHISTQANNVNYRTFQFWHKLGATRVVTARELSIKEIADIDAHIPEELEIETFVHGAMCISYSGRCLLSNYFTGRDANRGACTHRAVYKALNFHIRRNMAADFLQLCQGKLSCGNHTLCAQIPPEQPRLVVRAVCLRGNVQLDLRAHSLRNHEQSGIGNNQRIRLDFFQFCEIFFHTG